MSTASKTRTPPIDLHEIPALERGMQYIRDHFAQCPRLADIAAAAGLSPFHFHRRFRLHFGQTPLDVRVRLQIDKAKRLMLADVPLGEVATRCGFGHQQHFTSRFKLITGQTPGRWLRAQRDAPLPPARNPVAAVTTAAVSGTRGRGFSAPAGRKGKRTAQARHRTHPPEPTGNVASFGAGTRAVSSPPGSVTRAVSAVLGGFAMGPNRGQLGE